jgi:hypothetical protein
MTISYMLWAETNPKNTPAKTLADAIQRFTQKYGIQPTHVLAPRNWPENANIPTGITLERVRKVFPPHILIGAEFAAPQPVQVSEGDQYAD